ncbi:hypothetical protein TIFTF001_016452 [Ficus carica]|uniref:Disease resistance RPP13-like protein 1 n=1 Tax=Ficus carica TaxID=3494 RepID=A0AA88D7G2_FICCA|nr:hypothetical protein TIFTF001_016452 [Ficus carica]
MAELVGGALLSGFLNTLFDRLASVDVINFFQRKKLISKLFSELKITLLSANVLLNDAEEKQLNDRNMKKWLDELKEVIYEADRVMDYVDYEALRGRFEGGESRSKASKFLNFVPTMFGAFDNRVKFDIEDILSRLKLLLDQKDVLGLRECVRNRSPQRLLAPLVEECDVCGREADKEAIVKLLLSDDVSGQRVSVIPIVGMGGIGKTTLARLVYRDSRVEEHFDLKAWVIVSEEFDVFRITRTLFETITCRKCDVEDLYQLQDELKKALMGKRFLFVLDDIWNENYNLWDLLKSPFQFGEHGSKIIMTTRSKIAASKMGNDQTYDLQTIPDDDCLQLFAKHVFNNEFDTQSGLKEIGTEIVKKCKGLPLAVKSIASVLRSELNPEEWRRILQSDIWELQFQDDHDTNILPALWLSYHFLPPHLKRCFAYLSIFPKGYEFHESEKEKVIWLWMAEGLLRPQSGKRIEDVGEEYLNALTSRSFFQRCSWNESTFFMHDLMHDLAMHISGEFRFISDGYNGFQHLSSKTCHLSYKKESEDLIELEGLLKTKCLRSFLALPLSYEYIESTITKNVTSEVLKRGGCLRVLSLSQSSITELPNAVGNLHHLRYLDLSWTKIKEVPSSISTLYNLQTLLLSGCKELTQLPTNMSSLTSLRHLDLSDVCLKEMPYQIFKMKNLQRLSDFVLGENDGSRIKELGALQHLHGSLCISGLEHIVDIADVLEANMKNKKHLSKLILRWDGETDDSLMEREVLNALQPHANLKELDIISYRGTTFANWVAHPSICDEFRGTSSTMPFQKLEKLSFSGMLRWENWSFTETDQEGVVFPRLKELELQCCWKLKAGLPAGYLPSLKRITIWFCNEMAAVFPTSQQIDSAYPSLESLFISACSRVESFSTTGLPANLKQLQIHGCKTLFANRGNWDLQRLSSLQSLQLTGCEEVVDSFPEEGMLPIGLTSLDMSSFPNLKGLNGKGFQQLTSLQQLTICSCKELQCLPEEGLPLSLSYLDISKCVRLNPRCQRGAGEDWPKISHIPRIFIDWKRV